MIGVFGGLIAGLAFKGVFYPNTPVDTHLLLYCSLPGQLYLRLLFLLIVPLLVCSLSLSLLGKEEAEERSKKSSTEEEVPETSKSLDAKKLLLYTFAFFVALSMICAIAGILIMMFLKPGVSISNSIFSPLLNSTNFSIQNDPISLKHKQLTRSAERADSLYNLVW